MGKHSSGFAADRVSLPSAGEVSSALPHRSCNHPSKTPRGGPGHRRHFPGGFSSQGRGRQGPCRQQTRCTITCCTLAHHTLTQCTTDLWLGCGFWRRSFLPPLLLPALTAKDRVKCCQVKQLPPSTGRQTDRHTQALFQAWGGLAGLSEAKTQASRLPCRPLRGFPAISPQLWQGYAKTGKCFMILKTVLSGNLVFPTFHTAWCTLCCLVPSYESREFSRADPCHCVSCTGQRVLIIDDAFSINHSSSVLNQCLHSCCDGYTTSQPLSSFPDTTCSCFSPQEPIAPLQRWENHIKPSWQRAASQPAVWDHHGLQRRCGNQSTDGAVVPTLTDRLWKFLWFTQQGMSLATMGLL